MRQALCIRSVHPNKQFIIEGLRGWVHHYYCNLTIRIAEGRGENLSTVAGTADAFCTRFNKLRKMANVMVGVRVNQLAAFGVGVQRRKTKVANVIRATGFVQQNVPVRPG